MARPTAAAVAALVALGLCGPDGRAVAATPVGYSVRTADSTARAIGGGYVRIDVRGELGNLGRVRAWFEYAGRPDRPRRATAKVSYPAKAPRVVRARLPRQPSINSLYYRLVVETASNDRILGEWRRQPDVGRVGIPQPQRPEQPQT